MPVTELDKETNDFFKSNGAAMDAPPEPADKPAAAEPAPSEAETTRARDEQGRFVKADEPEAKAKPEAKPEAESKPDKGPEKASEKSPDGYVPHGALHEERERRKQLQKEIEELRTRGATMESRFNQLLERFKPQPPDPQQDPVGHLNHRLSTVEEQNRHLQQAHQQTDQERQQQQQWQRFVNAYDAAAQQFAASTADYYPAYNFIVKARVSDFIEAGYDNAHAAELARREEAAIVAKAFQDGANPAERMYKLAVRRGYTKAAPAASAATEQPKMDPTQKLETIERGQRAAPPFSAGAAGKPKLTLEAVAAMSDEEFGKLDWEKTMRELAA